MRSKILFVIFAAIVTTTSITADARLVRSPIYTALFTIQVEAQDEFVASIKEFAFSNDFSGHKYILRPETHQISIHLHRDELKVSMINENDGTRFHLGIYDIGNEEVTLTELNSLVADLQQRLQGFGDVEYEVTRNTLASQETK